MVWRAHGVIWGMPQYLCRGNLKPVPPSTAAECSALIDLRHFVRCAVRKRACERVQEVGVCVCVCAWHACMLDSWWRSWHGGGGGGGEQGSRQEASWLAETWQEHGHTALHVAAALLPADRPCTHPLHRNTCPSRINQGQAQLSQSR